MNVTDELRLSFGAKGQASAYTGRGWSNPEATETWCIGTRSELRLPCLAPGRPHMLTLNLRPFVSPRHVSQQALRLLVDDVEIASFQLSKQSVRACRISPGLFRGRDELLLTLETPNAAVPSDRGNKERRPLAVAFSSMTLWLDHAADAGVNDLMLEDHTPIDIDRVMQADRMRLSDLMLQFESLGQNCEFGLVQRECNAEPLGLLRFSSTPLLRLLAALDHRFEGMGEPGSVEVVISPNGREYMVQDRSFGFLYHAWVKTGEMSPEDVQRREGRRIPFLVRKLMEDLAAGEKIFVFKGMGSLPEEDVYPLAAALRRYGPNTLLLVNLATEERRAGSVEMKAPGFLVGYVDRFAPTENAADFCLEQWVKVCREAYRLVTVARESTFALPA